MIGVMVMLLVVCLRRSMSCAQRGKSLSVTARLLLALVVLAALVPALLLLAASHACLASHAALLLLPSRVAAALPDALAAAADGAVAVSGELPAVPARCCRAEVAALLSGGRPRAARAEARGLSGLGELPGEEGVA